MVAERGDDVPAAARVGFGHNAAAYERSRPSYPAEAVSCIVGRCNLGPGRRVLDLAAGTGKLTRLLVPSGAEVVAVEPVAAMREQLAANVPAVEVHDATAEHLPFEGSSFDAVTVAQAFHWFDAGVALPEMARVLRPGGVLALVWNTRDRSHDWVRRFGDLLVDGRLERPYDSYYDVDYAAILDRSALFGPVSRFEVAWGQPFDPDLLVERAASISVVGALAEPERQAVLGRVRDLAATHPELAGRSTFEFPYVSWVLWCRRR